MSTSEAPTHFTPANCGKSAVERPRHHRFAATRSAFAVAAVATAVAVLTGCTPTVALHPAPDAANPECAEVIVRLVKPHPVTVDNKEYRYTDAQGTGAWGEPAAVLLRCGVPVPGPTTLPCVTVRGVDWIRDDTDAPVFVFTTYGRDPAVEVIVDSDAASGTNSLVALANAVGVLPKYTECVDPDDVFEFPEE